MDAQQFAYWLQGFAELNGEYPPSAEQWKSIRDHLALVFSKVTPPVRLPQPLVDWEPSPVGPYPYEVRCKVTRDPAVDGGTATIC